MVYTPAGRSLSSTIAVVRPTLPFTCGGQVPTLLDNRGGDALDVERNGSARGIAR